MIKVIKDKFDPILLKHIEIAKKYHEVYFYIEDSNSDKIKMVKMAIRPYRHFHLINSLDNLEYELIDIDVSAEYDKVYKGEFKYLSANTRNYIFSHGLYLDRIMANHCHGKRYKHVLSMCYLACKLARKHHVDVNKVYLAAMMHDIYKQNDEDENLALMNKYFKEHVNEAKALYHQYLGAYFVSSVLLYHDIKVYEAIYHHTTGTCTNKIAMIIYIADKIDPSRGYDITKQLKVAMNNLTDGYHLVRKENLEYLQNVEGKDIGLINNRL